MLPSWLGPGRVRRSTPGSRIEAMGESRRRRDFERQRPGERLGDAPVEEAYHEQMVLIAKAIDAVFNGDGDERKIGFCLMVFPFGPGPEGRCNYVSNAKREEIVLLLKEQLARFQ